MNKMLNWLSYLLWTSEIVFLAASTPHIATYFEHFDNPTDLWGQIYSWIVGYGLALTIDGVSFVVLMSVVVAVKYRRSAWLTAFLVFALLLISSLSWFINWQYDIVFSSQTFAKADQIQIHTMWNTTNIGSLNPLIGGAFPLLGVLYALVAKALEVDESALSKKALTEEQFENEKRRLQQERELKSLKASGWDGKGILTSAKERLIGTSMGDQSSLSEQTQDDYSQENDRSFEGDSSDTNSTLATEESLSSSFASARNVPLEYACELLECDIKTVKQLISKGKLRTPANSQKLVTRTSIDEYLLTRKRRKTPSQESHPSLIDQQPEYVESIATNGNGHSHDTDPLGLPVLTITASSMTED